MTQKDLDELPSDVVKAETADLHDLVEETLGERFFQGDELDREGFVELLKCFYHVYSPLENRMIPILQATLPDYDYDPRAIRLRQDFRELGLETETIDGYGQASPSELVDLTDYPELLGCLYVVEGSEMGNHVMRSQLDEMLPESCLGADNFFRDRGESTRERWSDFKEKMDEMIKAPDELDRMIEAARETFNLFRKGFEWHGNS